MKLLNICLSMKIFPPYFMVIISSLYFSIYFETSSILGPSFQEEFVLILLLLIIELALNFNRSIDNVLLNYCENSSYKPNIK